MFIRISGLTVWLVLLLSPFDLQAQESRARSVLVLDQSEPRGPFYFQIFSGIRAELNADTGAHTSLYAENLDLSRFNGKDYEASLQRHLKQKYRDRNIGVIVAVGVATLDRGLIRGWSAADGRGLGGGQLGLLTGWIGRGHRVGTDTRASGHQT